MQFFKIVALLLFLLFFGIIIQNTSADDDWQEKVKELKNDGKYDEALKVLEKTTPDQKQPDIYYMYRGAVYESMGEYEKAIDDYNKAYTVYKHQLSNIYLANIANVYALQGDYNKSIETYKSALQKGIPYDRLEIPVWADLGYTYLKNNDYKNALKTFETAINKAPEYAYAWAGKGDVYYATGDLEKSRKSYEKALSYDSESEKALKGLDNLNSGKTYSELQNITNTETKEIKTNNETSLDSNVGEIKLDTIPAGATVIIDGDVKGTTPFTENSINVGLHSIIISMSGYQDISLSLPISSEYPTDLSFSLSENMGNSESNSAQSYLSNPYSQGEDLMISDLNQMYDSSTREITFDVTAKNIGSSPTKKRFDLAYFLTKSKTNRPFMDNSVPQYLLGTDSISGLNEGEIRAASQMKKLTIQPFVPAGSYWFGIYLDSGDQIPETDETNNVLYSNEEITIKES